MKLELNAEALIKLAEGLEESEPSKPEGDAARLALNRTLDWTYTRTVRQVSAITGMQQRRVRKVLRKVPSPAGQFSASIVGRDTFTSLKDFKARQLKAGVKAAPWKKSRLFSGTFIGPGGHVYKRTGDGHGIKKLYGPAIPNEMIRGDNMKPVLDEALGVQYPMHLEFFENRALERAKSRHNL